MDRREIAGLLAYMGRLDPRTMRTDPGELRDQVDQWQELLGDVPLATDYGWDARTAVRAHVVSSPYPVLPVDVARQWSKHSGDRLARHTDPVPAADPDDVESWRAELLGTRHAVLAGQRPPNEQAAITSGTTIDPAVEARLRAIGSVIPPAVRAELSLFRPTRAAREAAAVEGRPDPLTVRCEWCHAPAGEPCRNRRMGLDGRARGNARRAKPHPSRLDLAAAALHRQESAA
ncbi:hypothetical protein OG520_10810 [Streptomyces sp. NBC_00984]|uniref:zinc finger domain-containing protein n=1 Tax=Streptomyces sp. NBC_00984 TaxID=2903700 RepID=UPI003870C5B9|nr:hypothetical protein OG520_10810 [Streptomyces sp. NBC_00984]